MTQIHGTAPAPAAHSVLDPAAVRALVPQVAESLAPDLWVHRFDHPDAGWTLSVATHAAPGSGRLSLGGFRIAPESRTTLPGWSADREAIGLAVGMEEKVHWSRVLRVAGPLARAHLDRIVGGKCVLHPTPDARVGAPRDEELLAWAVGCLQAVDATGIHVVTGQDLGHGLMHDGRTSSLDFMHARFDGSMRADTSRPTAEGNLHLLCGMLAGCGVPVRGARVLLVGAGNIGRTLLARLQPLGARVTVVEASPATRARLAADGVEARPAEARLEALAGAFDAVVVNAAGGSLDTDACAAIAANPAVRVVCGSENLAMPDPTQERTLLAAGKVYAHPELGGMMGYLTAVEEYLARRAGVPFDVATLLDAAHALHAVGERATRRVLAGNFQETFQAAATATAGASAA